LFLHICEAELYIRCVLSNRLLLVHRTVVEAGTLTAAAHELGFTVSAVSQQLATLETQAGVSLYERVGRGVRPTAAGRLLAERAGRVLREVAHAEAALADLREGRTGRVRVLTFHSAGEALLPQAIAMLRAEHPAVRVLPSVDESPGALRRLRDAEVDLVLVVEPFGPSAQPTDDLRRWHLLADPYRLLVPHDHPLARRRKVPVTALADEPWVVTIGPDDYVRTTTIDLCRRAGFSPRIAAESDEFPVTQGYVAAGLGVSLVPVLALGAVRRGVVVRKLSPAPPPRQIWLATRPALLDVPAVAALAAALVAVAAPATDG
jgi:DNA-binding transcriptional LysR family regulator